MLPNLSTLALKVSSPGDAKGVGLYDDPTDTDDDSVDDDEDFNDARVCSTPRMLANERHLNEAAFAHDLAEVIEKLQEAYASVLSALDNDELEDKTLLRGVGTRLDADIRLLKKVATQVGLKRFDGGFRMPVARRDIVTMKKSLDGLVNLSIDQWGYVLALVGVFVYALTMYFQDTPVAPAVDRNPFKLSFPASATPANQARALRSFRYVASQTSPTPRIRQKDARVAN